MNEVIRNKDILGIIFGKLDFVSKVRFRSVFRRFEIVDIDENWHYKITPEVLSWFPKLEYISLDSTSRVGISDIMKMTNLKKLFIEDISCETEKLSCLTGLVELHLCDMPNVTDVHICNLTNLKNLCIRECPEITGQFLYHLTNLESLRLFEPYYTRLPNHVDDLSHQTNLKELAISARLTDGNQLSKLTNLRKLSLYKNYGDIVSLSLPNLQYLELYSSGTWIDCKSLKLQRLTIGHSYINFAELHNLNLQELELSYRQEYTDFSEFANLPIKKLLLHHPLTEQQAASLSNSSFKIQILK